MVRTYRIDVCHAKQQPYLGIPCIICSGHYESNVLVTSNGPVCFTCIDNWVGDILQMRTPWDKSQWEEDE